MRQVACPVALHPDGAPRRIAVFEHPSTGLQLVKCEIANMSPAAGAAHALFDQSGLETSSAIAIGQSADIQDGENWHFALCRIKPPVRDRWQHLSADNSEHLFKFWWMHLDATPPAGFDPRDLRALDWIRGAI